MVLLNVMTDNHHTRRRFLTSNADDDDIISNLPEDLIDPILERLPVKDAVRISVLSKKWRYRWTTMKTLALDKQFSQQFLKIGAFSCNGFIRVLNQIMILHNGPIFKFVLHIPNVFLDSFKEIDQWMLILSRNNVRELKIVNEIRFIKFHPPCSVPPLAFKGFPNLQEILLTYVNFGDNLGGSVINLPHLKSLILYGCGNVNHFNIKAGKLQILLVDGYPNAMLIRLLHGEHLFAVKICLPKSIKDLLQVEKFSFIIHGNFLKV
ncbi:putative F-box domain, leucine-rich repeat domain superfamily, F-box-like domain superfamily [Helianthus anomalus]